MRSPSTTTIDQKFVALEERASFRNQVARGLWQGKNAYRKKYPEWEYWHNEITVLNSVSDHDELHVPHLYQVSEVDLVAVISVMPGEKFAAITTHQVHRLAVNLRTFHHAQLICALVRLDLGERLALFRNNIVEAECLNLAEKRTAEQAIELAQAELLPRAHELKQLVHGDFNLGNVLYDPQSDQVGLIDFERAHTGFGLLDIAKGAWRILNNNPEAIEEFLLAYYGRLPTAEERRSFVLAQLYEYLGSVSYFAFEGYKNGFPYKDEAINHIAQCLIQF